LDNGLKNFNMKKSESYRRNLNRWKFFEKKASLKALGSSSNGNEHLMDCLIVGVGSDENFQQFFKNLLEELNENRKIKLCQVNARFSNEMKIKNLNKY
jgi:hypothetical protein